MPSDDGLAEILLAQIEAHRMDVFYNLDPIRYDGAFSRRLPGCVRHIVAWRAAPSANLDLGGYDMIVCNFPSIIQAYRTAGWRAEHLFPGHDPAIDPYGDRTDRDVDIVFAGGYSRHHTRRAAILEAVSSLARKRRVVFHLDRSRVTTLAEYPIGRILPLTRHRRPAAIRAASAPPVCDRALYGTLSGARVVLNGAVDMAGNDRGNMRCIEAMGCGAVMVSDAGNYPEGMIDGRTMFTCKDAEDTVRVVEGVLALPDQGRSVAAEGLRLVRERYSKAAQWKRFQHLVENK